MSRPSFVELFRTLSSFAPSRVDLREAPWEAYVDWAIANGLAPLAAYNLEYRLGPSGSPEWARDRLLSIFQGTANDNVMKLVGFRNTVELLEGRRLVLMGAASFVESLYPHVAFRPVVELEVLVAPREVAPCVGFLARTGFVPGDQREGEGGVAGGGATLARGRRQGPSVTELSDSRTSLLVHGGLTGDGAEDEGLLRRALPVRVLGPSVFRLDLEDAILALVLRLGRAAFERPMIELVDLRELLKGAPGLGGDYSRPLDAEALLRRASVWGVERTLWTALALAARLFPELEAEVARASPPLARPTRELLERLVVAPLADLGRAERYRGEELVRRALTEP